MDLTKHIAVAAALVAALAVACAARAAGTGAGDAFAPQRAEFAKYHRLATGKDAPSDAVCFAIDPSVSQSGRDAYRITSIVRADGVARAKVTGSNLRSVWYGLYDLLERRAGCRWFWDGDAVPERESIDLGGLDIKEESRFEYRAMRYFAHRGLTRFQAEHWGPEEWRREIDWALKSRLNVLMLRIGQDDLFQRAFPEACKYPDPAKPQPGMYSGYNDRTLFWSLQFRGELRRRVQKYAFDRGISMPEDFGTMSHWYSPTPDSFLKAKNPPFLPQANSTHSQSHLRVWDVRKPEWAEAYWKLTQTALDAYGKGAPEPLLLHTIGLGERRCFKDRKANFDMKKRALKIFLGYAKRDYPGAKVLLAGWDFYNTWRVDEVKAVLAELDKDSVVLWDYEGDFRNAKSNFTKWDVIGKFPYTYSTFLAYESALDTRADYPFIEERMRLVAGDPACKGWIFWPESSHTDTLFLEYFVRNAWKPGAATPEAALDSLCKGRYGERAEKMKRVWEAALPASRLRGTGDDDSWCLNCIQHLMYFGFEKKGCEKRAAEWAAKAERAVAALKDLAGALPDNDFARRDAIDLARMALDRLVTLRTDELGRGIAAWRKGESDGASLPARAKEVARLCNLLADVLALHTDYSLQESLERLDAIEKIRNPAFGKTLFENAVNRYCLSHQYEAVRHVAAPAVEAMAERLAKAVEAGDRKAVFAPGPFMAKFRKAAKERKLEELAPHAPRTRENLLKTLYEAAAAAAKTSAT